MSVQKLLGTAVTMFLMSAGAAYAATVTVDGSYTISYTPTTTCFSNCGGRATGLDQRSLTIWAPDLPALSR